MPSFKHLTSMLFLGVVIILAIALGVLIPQFTGFAGERLGVLFALPGVMVFGLLFAFNRKLLFLLVILFRSVLDPIFEMTKFGANGSGVGLGGVINALVICLAAIEIFRQPYPAFSNIKSVWGAFLLVITVSAAASPNISGALKMNLGIISYAAIFILPVFLIKSKDDFSDWMKAVLCSSAIPVFYGFLQLALGIGFKGHAEEGFRISSTFSHPNIFAFYLVLIITLSYSVLRGNLVLVTTSVRRLLPVYILLMLILLVMTKTRSAWGACFIYFFCFGLLIDRKVLIPVMLMPFLALAIPDVRERLLDISTGNEHIQYARLDSYTWRKNLWTNALEWMEPIRYFFGYGAYSFVYYSPFFGGHGMGAHSVYIQLLFEAGIIGVSSFFWLIVNSIRRIKSLFYLDKVSAFTIIMLLIEYAVVSYSDNMLDYLVYNWYLWFVVGAACTLNAIEQASTTSPELIKTIHMGDRNPNS